MTSGDVSVPETALAKRTQDEHVEEMYGHIYTGSGKSNNETLIESNSTKAKPKPRVANTLPAAAANRKLSADLKKGNDIFASVSSSSATKVKNEDNNIHFHPRTSERKEKKAKSRKRQDEQFTYRQYNSMIQQIPEIAARCENYARKCTKVLKDMNKLLRTNRKENLWHQWNLQEMGSRIRQSEYNATVIPASMRKQFNPVTNAACTPRSRVFTPKSGNVKSTMLSTETARSRKLASNVRPCTRPNFLSGQRKL